jgi:hypothetical protein
MRMTQAFSGGSNGTKAFGVRTSNDPSWSARMPPNSGLKQTRASLPSTYAA